MEARLREALEHQRSGRLQDAEMQARQLLEEHPDNDAALQLLALLALARGDAERAKQHADRACALNPTEVRYRLTAAEASGELGRLDEALDNLDTAFSMEPRAANTSADAFGAADFVGVSNGLARRWMKEGRLDGAAAMLDRAIALDEAVAQTHHLRGLVFLLEGKPTLAVERLTRASTLEPGSSDMHLNLGVAHEHCRAYDRAAEEYRRAVALTPGSVDALFNLGNVLRVLRRSEEAIDAYEQALALQPGDADALHNLQLLRAASVPRWHFTMLHDRHRNEAYDRAIRRLVTPESIVLDIGTGSGLLAIMAARAGARHVYACEFVKTLSDKAREIVALNGFSDRVTVINKRSTDLVVGVDLPERANFLVTETFDVGLVGEGVVTSVSHALDQLLVPDAIVMPGRAWVYAALVDCPALDEFGRVEDAVGIDLRPFNVFATGLVNQRLASYPHTTLCEPFEVFSFDFTRPIERAARELSVHVDRDGLCNAIVFWYKLELDPDTHLSTDPQTPSHWHQAIQLLDERVELAAGKICRVAASHNCASISLGLL